MKPQRLSLGPAEGEVLPGRDPGRGVGVGSSGRGVWRTEGPAEEMKKKSKK